jgi:hypothetical protein
MSDNKVKTNQYKPAFVGGVKEIKNDFFYYGRGMSQKCMSSTKIFLDHIGSKFGESVKQSIEQNAIIITEMREPKNYATEKECWND